MARLAGNIGNRLRILPQPSPLAARADKMFQPSGLVRAKHASVALVVDVINEALLHPAPAVLYALHQPAVAPLKQRRALIYIQKLFLVPRATVYPTITTCRTLTHLFIHKKV